MTGLPPITEAAVRARLDAQARPPGSLGRIEDVAVQLALIQQRMNPRADAIRLLIFAADHGLTEDGVSRYPAEVTQAMVATFLAGKGTANAFARAVGAEVTIIDAGVNPDLAPHPVLIDAKVGRGTRNAARDPAMTLSEAEQALQRGRELAIAVIERGTDVLALGEMGIGNSSSAALLMHRLAPASLSDSVGQGAGHDADGLAHKLSVLTRASERSDAVEPLEVLRQFGGFEIAMMAGAIHGAADRSTPVVIDGFICTAAALVAIRLRPETGAVCLFAHRSAEAGHDRMLKILGAEPLLDLGLRLGEGTGALLAAPLLRAAAALLSDVARLDDVMAGRL
ncbi:nicotinate-nucleotide--dimethylbenzimidazole phosphoribosyltransferase [Phenylobacterium sp.]|jgi:nicotinate-nucleotide--dimethylbenzimidazole phosphoribosyltransferase|uniref:nicotinate-nucleotide--dimethylbenzimidazole phosphoribosyltransferase n=1 Tax=Phenylobacterium sp. TaxID=1871053 RepID=UPI0037C69578